MPLEPTGSPRLWPGGALEQGLHAPRAIALGGLAGCGGGTGVDRSPSSRSGVGGVWLSRCARDGGGSRDERPPGGAFPWLRLVCAEQIGCVARSLSPLDGFGGRLHL